ncbi:MAG: calcium-binding protein [Bauldia sp.]|nr:calcium-binding protein [Bauldia sp.]
MALPVIQRFSDFPFYDGEWAFEASLQDGMFLPASQTRFVVATPDGVQTVFKGSFTVVGGVVTGGTITDYVTKMNGTTVFKGSGFALDAAATVAAIQAYQGGDFDAVFKAFFANDTAKKIVGSANDDDLFVAGDGSIGLGKAGNDYVGGNTYGVTAEILKGGAGNDRIDGNGGADVLYGGKGKDAFWFTDAPDPSAFARIKDFSPKDDTIIVDVTEGFAAVHPGPLDDSQFHVGGKAKTADQVLIYDKKTGALYYDADGSGSEQQVQFAKLAKHLSLTADDFFGAVT